MATIGQNRVIHRFIRPIAEYEAEGSYYNQVIPVDTQAYAYYPDGERDGTNLWYVFGDGIHTYTEIRDGKGTTEGAKEFPVFTAEIMEIINTIGDTYAKKEDVYTKDDLKDVEVERRYKWFKNEERGEYLRYDIGINNYDRLDTLSYTR